METSQNVVSGIEDSSTIKSKKKLALDMLTDGLSLEEVRQQTGYSIGYVRNLDWERRNPGAMARAHKKYLVRYPEKRKKSDAKYLRNWRSKNKDKRNQSRKKYYNQTANAPNGGNVWTTAHIDRITAPDRPRDRVLSQELGRSVSAIQNMRCLLKK